MKAIITVTNIDVCVDTFYDGGSEQTRYKTADMSVSDLGKLVNELRELGYEVTIDFM